MSANNIHEHCCANRLYIPGLDEYIFKHDMTDLCSSAHMHVIWHSHAALISAHMHSIPYNCVTLVELNVLNPLTYRVK